MAAADHSQGELPMMPGWIRQLSWYTALLALVAGGLIHIAVTMMVPQLATAGAFQDLAQSLPINRMRILPPFDAATQPLPYMGPDVRIAVCRFDVSDSPVAIKVNLPDSGWMLALYTEWGDNFFVLPAQEGRAADVNLTLTAPSERSFSLLSLGGRTAQTSISQIEAPEKTGFAVIRAPMRGRAFAGEIEETLKRAGCEAGRG